MSERGENENNPPVRSSLQDFDPKNMTPQERDAANVVVRCTLESIAISGALGILSFRQTGRYIAAKGTPKMKSWASVIKFGVGFFSFSLVRNVYGRGVCLPRVRTLPPSPVRDQILAAFDMRNNPDPVPLNLGDKLSTTAPQIVHPITSKAAEVNKLELDEEQIDFKTHQTDDKSKSFDVDKDTHVTHKGKDFDYSKSYRLPPAAETPSRSVRRNKYGDIIEEA